MVSVLDGFCQMFTLLHAQREGLKAKANVGKGTSKVNSRGSFPASGRGGRYLEDL